MNLLVHCQNANPGEIFDKNMIEEEAVKKFKESLIKINNKLISMQTDEIYRVVNLCIQYSNNRSFNYYRFRIRK